MEVWKGRAASSWHLIMRLAFSQPLWVTESTCGLATAGPAPQILDDPGGALPYPRASYIACELPTLLCRTKSN